MTNEVNPIHAVLGWGESRPDQPALVSAQLSMSYRDLADSVRRMAAKFRSVGIRPGHVVAVRAGAELEAIVMLALLHEGAVSMAGGQNVLTA